MKSIILEATKPLLDKTESKASITPAEWIKSKSGLTMYTGKDKVLSRYAFRGAPSFANMGIDDWPDEEVSHFNDDSKAHAIANKFKHSRPRHIMINMKKKLIVPLYAGYTNGEDRTHHSGFDWIRDNHGSTEDWYPVMGGMDGAYIFEGTPKEVINAALKLGFLKRNATLTTMGDQGYKKIQLTKYLSGFEGVKHKPALSIEAKRIVASINKVYDLELKYSAIESTVGMDGKKKEALGKQLISAIKNVNFDVSRFIRQSYRNDSVDVHKLEEYDDFAALSKEEKKRAVLALDPIMKEFKKLENLLYSTDNVGSISVAFNVAKQRLHYFTKTEPEIAAAIFGSKEIAMELTKVSAR